MAKINLIHDHIGKTLTIHIGDPKTEYTSELTDDEILIMKDKDKKIIGIEILHFNSEPDDHVSMQIIPKLG